MSKKLNSIKPREHGVEVSLDPTFLLNHALYMPDGETIIKSNMTLGQAIEAIALAHIKARTPHLAANCQIAWIEFQGDRFVIKFADTMEYLAF